ncbi:hypothetical protein PS3A_34830 [Pseudomonas sp. 3A(2025)]
MDISLNTALSPQLTLSTASIKATTEALDPATTKTFDTPAAVYHPSAEATALSQASAAGNNWVGKPDYADFPAMVARHQAAHNVLKASFDEFKSALAYAFPDLAEKKFGFTIDEDGNLKALNTTGELSGKDLEQLDTLLNASSALKRSAEAYRDASIDMVAAESPLSASLYSEYVLNKENFAKTIDLADLFIERKDKELSSEKVAGWFNSQLWRKGEYVPAQYGVVEQA